MESERVVDLAMLVASELGKPFLQSASLLSRAIHAAALASLFHRVSLTDTESVTQLYTLTRPKNYPKHIIRGQLVQLPNPLRYIRLLSIAAHDLSDRGTSAPAWIAKSMVLHRLLEDIVAHSGTNGIRHFNLFSAYTVDWFECGLLRSGLQNVILSSRPSTLELAGLQNLPYNLLLSAMMHSAVLSLECVSVQKVEAGPEPDSHGLRSESATGLLLAPLRELNIKSSPGIVPDFLAALQRLVVDDMIRFRRVETVQWMDLEFQDVPSVTEILACMVEHGSEVTDLALVLIENTPPKGEFRLFIAFNCFDSPLFDDRCRDRFPTSEPPRPRGHIRRGV